MPKVIIEITLKDDLWQKIDTSELQRFLAFDVREVVCGFEHADTSGPNDHASLIGQTNAYCSHHITVRSEP